MMDQDRNVPAARTRWRQILVVTTVLAIVASACVRSVDGGASTGCRQLAATNISPGQILVTLTTKFANVYPVDACV